MELLVIIIIFVLGSRFFGPLFEQMSKGQRQIQGQGKGRGWDLPFPNQPSEWNFPRPVSSSGGEPRERVDSQSSIPDRGDAVIPKGQQKQVNTSEKDSESIYNLDENFFNHQNLVTGFIMAEILQPPKSKRGAR